MKKKLLFLGALVLLCVAATQIQWYSQQPNAGSLQDTDIGVIERMSPHAYNSFTLAQLKAYIGGSGGLVPPSISVFNNNKGNVEIGSTVSGTVLTWALGGGAADSQSINQGIGSVPVGTLTATDASSFTANRTYTLTVSNGLGQVSANTSVTFLSKRYWGASALTSLTDNDIKGLSQELANTFVGFSKPVVCNLQYVYFAFPSSFGTPIIYMPIGLQNTAWTLVTRNFQNASGFTTSYDIYRSNNLLTGTFVFLLQ